MDPRFIRGTASALRSWLLTSVPTPICLFKPFPYKACPENTVYIWAGTGMTRTPTIRFAQETMDSLAPQNIEYKRSECIFDLSNPKPRLTTGGSGRGGARWGGEAQRGRPERDADGSVRPRNNRPLCPPGIEDNYPEQFFGSKDKENPM